MGLTYWLRGIQELDKKAKQALFDYLASYVGPHQIIIFIPQVDNEQYFSKKASITIPKAVNAALFAALLNFFNKKVTATTEKFIQQLCASYNSLSLDRHVWS